MTEAGELRSNHIRTQCAFQCVSAWASLHGGPLWQPFCYAQVGGLALATVIELVLVPVFYAVFVLDLKIIKWGKV